MISKSKKISAIITSVILSSYLTLSFSNEEYTFDVFATTEISEETISGNWSEYANPSIIYTSDKNAIYEISTPDELATFAATINNNDGNWYGTVKLVSDIDLSGHYWLPIGYNNSKFKGVFDGQNYKIMGMTVSDSAIETDYTKKYNWGLFGCNYGIIKNIILDTTCSIAAYDDSDFYVGAICGQNYNTIENCSNFGKVSGKNYLAGICGYNDSDRTNRTKGTILNCYNAGDIEGNGIIGGICSYHSDDGVISDCYNTGNIKGKRALIGGICGNSFGEILNCYNNGNIFGSESIGEMIAGVCGYMGVNRISNCYNTGNVSGRRYVGGICGYIYYQSTVLNCYNIGNISGELGIGGICGENSKCSLVTNCYNIGEVTGSYAAEIDGCSNGENKCSEHGSSINNYYLAQKDDGNGGKTINQFTSGEVAYLLQYNQKEEIWGQNLTGQNINEYPIIGGNKVCKADENDSNNNNILYVNPKPDIVYGDLNIDGAVDLTDLTTLSLYLLGDLKLNETQLASADVNGDDETNLADLAHFKQYISKDNVILGK